MRRCCYALLWVAPLLLVARASADDEVKITPDVVYGHKDGLAMTFDVYHPPQAHGGAVLFMVSGGWFSAWQPPERTLPLFQPLFDRGLSVIAVRHGSAPKYFVPDAVADVRRAVRFVRLHAADWGIDPQRLGVTGLSAGGHLSLMLGLASDEGDSSSPDEVLHASDRVAAVVAVFPPTDLRAWVADTPDNLQQITALKFDVELADDVSPIVHVSADDPPVLLIHGDKDDLVPIDHSHNLKAELDKAGVENELLVIEGAGHGFQGDDNLRSGQALVDWFDRHLAPPAGEAANEPAAEPAPN
jgi:acetyl esterase/lipase